MLDFKKACLAKLTILNYGLCSGMCKSENLLAFLLLIDLQEKSVWELCWPNCPLMHVLIDFSPLAQAVL